MTHPPGTIVVLNHDTGRYSATHECLLAVHHPEGTRIVHAKGADVARARNEALRTAAGEWVWFMDDDHQWLDPKLLMHLLDRQVDVVQPLVLRRVLPFSPVVSRVDPTTDSGYVACDVHELGTTGLAPVASCGMGGTLIRRHVWETMPAPWFTVGQIEPDKLGEDVSFTRKLKDYGFQAWVDVEHTMDHLRVCAIRPKYDPEHGQWYTVVALDEFEVMLPAARRQAAEIVVPTTT